jgi:hypothetical protein
MGRWIGVRGYDLSRILVTVPNPSPGSLSLATLYRRERDEPD